MRVLPDLNFPGLIEKVQNYGKREIKIRVSGKNKKDLLTIVTYELDEIHASYESLKYQKLIPCNCSECKNTQEPHFYPFEILQRFRKNRQEYIQCQKSFEMVNVLNLIDDISKKELAKFEPASGESKTQNSKLAQRKNIIELNRQNDENLAKKYPKIYQLYLKAKDYENKHKFYEAIRSYEKLIDNSGYYLNAWLGLERVYRNLGENQKLVSTLEQIQLIRDIIDFETNAEQKITLQQLKLTNLDFFGNFEWKFQPQINILLGKNGYGKSYLLQLIISLLQRDNNISSQFFGDKSSNASIQLDIEANKTDKVILRSKIVFEKSIGKVPVLAIPDVRYVDKSRTTISLFDDEQRDLRENGAYHFLYQKSFEAVIQNFLYELCIMFIDQGRSFDLPIFNLLHKVIQELTDEAFKFCQIKPIGDARFEIDVITDGNNNRLLPIEKASQGTLAVLSMFGLIYYYLKSVFPDTPVKELLSKPAIVFIDEVDAHLHPSWQQKIIRLLRENFPNVQFVLTAHSPLVVAGCLNGEVAVLRKGKDGFVIEELKEDLLGVTTEKLYKKLFEIEDIDENYLYYATLLSLNIDNSERINELESKETLTEDEEKELDKLHKDDYYLSRVAERTEEKEAENHELTIAKLEAKIRELKYQVELVNKKDKREG